MTDPQDKLDDDRDGRVDDNTSAGRFEINVGGQVAFLVYERRGGDQILLVHTEVPPALRGQRIGDRLAKAALEAARRERRRVIPVCPFVRAYLRRHAGAQN